MPENRNERRQPQPRRRRRKRGKTFRTPKELAVCPLCEQSIRDILTAIIISEDGTAAHFDCILKKITEEEDLRPKEKICYLGAGEFGIVRFNSPDSRKFMIRKRIRYETKDHTPQWRKEISEGLTG